MAPTHRTALEFSNNKDDYELLDPIGKGATACVYAALFKPLNEKVAVKVIDLERYGGNIDEIRKEIQVMSQCHHENVVTYYTSFVVKDQLWLVMRLLGGGSALEIMKHLCPKGFEETVIATILKEVLKALAYFHKNGQIHRDIKAGNILIDMDGDVQVADFGVSSWLVENGERRNVRQTFVGTPCWMAPEVMEQVSGYDYKADIWSFGITAIELASGHAPFAKYPPLKVLYLTLNNPPPTLDLDGEHKRYSKTFKKVVDACLQKDPTKRPTADELLKHDFFKKAKGAEYLRETLIAKLPPLTSRSLGVPKTAYRPGGSGRYRKSEDGGWDFEPFSEDDIEEEEESDEETPRPSAAKGRKISTASTASTDSADARSADEDDGEKAYVDTVMKMPQGAQGQAAVGVSQPIPVVAVAPPETAAPEASQPPAAAAPAPAPVATPAPALLAAVKAEVIGAPVTGGAPDAPGTVVQVKLRLRDKNRQLKDIRFGFTYGTDTPAGVARELVEAGLIDTGDGEVCALSIEQLLASRLTRSEIRFPLSQARKASADPATLKGYAQLSVVP
eukprot:Opistho-1_new@27789